MSLTGKPSLTTTAAVANDGFWLDLSVGDLMAKYRIPSEYADATIQWGLALAMVRVNEQLQRARDAIELLEYASFDLYITANPLPMLGSDVLVVHYEHAVYARAKAFLLQQFPSINRRDVAENEGKESEDSEQFWMDESAKSIASIMSVFYPLETHSANANTYVSSL